MLFEPHLHQPGNAVGRFPPTSALSAREWTESAYAHAAPGEGNAELPESHA